MVGNHQFATRVPEIFAATYRKAHQPQFLHLPQIKPERVVEQASGARVFFLWCAAEHARHRQGGDSQDKAADKQETEAVPGSEHAP